jgi:hypothetical protein
MGLPWINATASRRNVRWFTNGLLINPSGNTVLASTGAVGEPSEYHAYIIGASTAATRIRIRHRDASDTVDVEDPIAVPIGANTPFEFFVPVRLAKGERLTVINELPLTGNIAFSIILIKAYQDGFTGAVVEPDPGP